MSAPSSMAVDPAEPANARAFPANRAHYPALNGLRAFAVVLVFAQHYFVASTPPFLAWGWAGVDIFFVLSGFLITGILLDTVDAPHRLRNFYLRRTLRIFPLYYAVLLGIFLLTPFLHWQWSALWLLWPFYLGNYGPLLGERLYGNFDLIHYLAARSAPISLHFIHFWSLCVEEQFYLVWPFVVYSLRRVKSVRTVCIAVILLLPLVRFAMRWWLPAGLLEGGLLHRATFFRFDSFLIGGLVACILRGSGGRLLIARAGTLFTAALAALGFAWTFAALVLHQGWAPNANAPWMTTAGFTLLGLASAGLLLLALRPGSWAYRVLTLRPLMRLGEVSYGFYLFHEIPIEIYTASARVLTRGHIAHLGLVAAPIAFLCTILLSTLSFRFFEAPFLRLKARFSS